MSSSSSSCSRLNQLIFCYFIDFNPLVIKKNLGTLLKYAIFTDGFDRTMKVKIDSNYSESHNILSSIPEGSVLEHLFLISINDLPNDRRSKIELFADDVKIPVRP